jgi:sugar lactone lactonase YvrE
MVISFLPALTLPANAATNPDTIFYSGFIDGGDCLVKGTTLSGPPSTTDYHSSSSPTPEGVAADPSTGYVYYSDQNGHIYRSNLDGTGRTELVSGYYVNDIALDAENSKLYFTGCDTAYINFCLWSVPLAGGTPTEIYSAASGVPEGVAIDPLSGYLYFDSGEGKIYRYKISDGVGSKSEVVSGYFANDIAIDNANGRLYFSGCDAGFSSYCVWSVSVSGGTLTQIYPAPSGAPAPEGVAFDSSSGTLYYSDFNGNIYKYISGSSTAIITGFLANKLALLTSPPTLSSASASTVTTSGATLSFTSDKAGTYYYLVYAAADSAPTSATVKAQGTAVAKGTDAAAASSNTISVTGLSASTDYKAYIVVRDANGSLSDVSAISFSTLSAAPTVTGISPLFGTTAGGTSVTITGTGFDGSATVKFGDTDAASVTCHSSTH